MIDDLVQYFGEFVCYGTGELILRCIPRNLVRSALRDKPKATEILVQGKRKKSGKFTYQKHLKNTGHAESEKAWHWAANGALVLGSDVVALLGLLFWIIIFAATLVVYAIFFA